MGTRFFKRTKANPSPPLASGAGDLPPQSGPRHPSDQTGMSLSPPPPPLNSSSEPKPANSLPLCDSRGELVLAMARTRPASNNRDKLNPGRRLSWLPFNNRSKKKSSTFPPPQLNTPQSPPALDGRSKLYFARPASQWETLPSPPSSALNRRSKPESAHTSSQTEIHPPLPPPLPPPPAEVGHRAESESNAAQSAGGPKF